ncbi:MAG: IPT/TIG domain-containing protein [Ktedonobacterales bacterium]|nr:IPT/TIG domain-containing protein [Ktedonobacterales bacterium]
MATLGNATTGFTYVISGSWGDVAGGSYTVPSPGILVTGLNAYTGGDGGTPAGRLYVWQDSGGNPGTWLVRGSSTFTLPASAAWNYQGSLANNGGAGISSDLYLPAGTVIWIGCYSSSGAITMQGASSGATRFGNTSDGNFSTVGTASGGMGVLAAYLNYNPLAAPTISGVSPSVAPPGTNVTITGTAFLHVSGASGVTINGINAAYTVNSDTQITATVPSGAGGASTVVVTNPAGSASSSFTAGQIYYGDATGSGAVHSIVAVWYGTGSGVAQVAGVWVPNGTGGVKRVW